jgi:preprotein translocase subunit SecD
VWSLFAILLVAVLSVGATVLSGKTPLLGLDLKGGVSVVEKPQGKVTSSTLQEAQNIIDNRVNGIGVSNSNVTVQGNDIVIELPGAKNDTQVLNVVGQTARLYFRPVDCLINPYVPAASTTTTTPAQGHGETTTTAPGSAKAKAKTTTTTKATATTKAAAGALGGTRPDARLTSDIRALAAGAASTKTTNATPTTAPTTSTSHTATTKSSRATGTSGSATTTRSATTTTVPTTTTTASLATRICSLTSAQQQSYMPPGGTSQGLTPANYDETHAHATVVLPYYADYVHGRYVPSVRYVLGPAEMSGAIVKTATANLNVQNDQWEVDLSFTSKGSTLFNQYAAAHYACYKQNPNSYCAQQAIELDATVQSAPAIEAASYPGGATINGSTSNPFTSQQAQSLANALTYGSLPVSFVAQDISNVSPQIGTDSLKAGAVAGAVAVLLVLLYLLAYYRALGLVVVIGICMSGALLYAITTLLSQTNGLALTLSGVIGLIVSVGVTADSCVVYFERLKEEIRSGRTVRASVERGFNRAFRTILAADFSSFIAALILYALTVGDVRGFAFFLGLATLLNVVTTYFFTRPLVILLGRRSALTGGGALGVGRGLGAGRGALSGGQPI